jgi:hypothetical protein
MEKIAKTTNEYLKQKANNEFMPEAHVLSGLLLSLLKSLFFLNIAQILRNTANDNRSDIPINVVLEPVNE